MILFIYIFIFEKIIIIIQFYIFFIYFFVLFIYIYKQNHLCPSPGGMTQEVIDTSVI